MEKAGGVDMIARNHRCNSGPCPGSRREMRASVSRRTNLGSPRVRQRQRPSNGAREVSRSSKLPKLAQAGQKSEGGNGARAPTWPRINARRGPVCGPEDERQRRGRVALAPRPRSSSQVVGIARLGGGVDASVGLGRMREALPTHDSAGDNRALWVALMGRSGEDASFRGAGVVRGRG